MAANTTISDYDVDSTSGNDTSGNYTERDIFKSTLSPEASMFYGFGCGTLGILAVSSNLVAILMFALRKNKISVPEYFLVNLMISSFSFMFVSCPMVAISGFKQRWIFGMTGAIIHGFLAYFFGIVNIMSIFMVSLIRYLKTVHPGKPQLGTLNSTILLLIFSYLYALFWAGLPLVGVGAYGMEPHGISSSLDWASTRLVDRMYVLVAAFMVIILPSVIMLYFYARILVISRGSAVIRGNMGDVALQRRKQRERKLNQVVIMVMMGFVLAWLPYTAVSVDASIVGHYRLPNWSTAFVTIMAKVSGLTNPVIYLLFNDEYRKELISWVKKPETHKPSEAESKTDMTEANSARPHFRPSTAGIPAEAVEKEKEIDLDDYAKIHGSQESLAIAPGDIQDTEGEGGVYTGGTAESKL